MQNIIQDCEQLITNAIYVYDAKSNGQLLMTYFLFKTNDLYTQVRLKYYRVRCVFYLFLLQTQQ